MKLEEFKQYEAVKIAEIINGTMTHVHLNDGYWMTEYKEGDNIKEYGACQCFYAPVREEYPDYTIITSEQHLAYEKAKEDANNAEESFVEEEVVEEVVEEQSEVFEGEE